MSAAVARESSTHSHWRLTRTHPTSVADLNAATAAYIARLGAVSTAHRSRPRASTYNGVPAAVTPPAVAVAAPQPKSLEDMCGAFFTEVSEWKDSSEVGIAFSCFGIILLTFPQRRLAKFREYVEQYEKKGRKAPHDGDSAANS